MSGKSALAILAILACAAATRAGDWPLFRGPDRNGVSPEAEAPTKWGPEQSIKWKVALPGPGNSSPVVLGERVFLTAAENAQGTRRSLYCFDRADGKQRWVKSVSYDKPDPTHEQNPYAGSTPATDGERVVVWHGSAGVHCYDLDGEPLWSRDVGEIKHIWGYAGSPVFHGDAVILNCGPGDRTFVLALNKRTGEVLWQTDEPGGAFDKSPQTGNWLGSWSTPTVTKIDGKDVILVPMPGRVNGYDPASGKIVWTCRGTGPLAYTDVMIAGEGADKVGVYMAGYAGAYMAFKLTGSGDVTDTARLWRHDDKPPQRVGTGVVVGRHIYLPSEPAIQCIEVDTGKVVWQQRFPGQTFWASVTKVGDQLYVTSQRGVTYVFAANPEKYTPIAENDLGEGSNSTIAVSNGELFHRTQEHLYCIAGE